MSTHNIFFLWSNRKISTFFLLKKVPYLKLCFELDFIFFSSFISDLLQCTNEPNVSIPQLADLLIERTQNTSWVIVFKALVTIHNLMNYGNEVSRQWH